MLLFWINKWRSEIIQPVLKLCNTTDDFNNNNNINNSVLVYHQFFFRRILMITNQSSPSTWTSSQALAHFGPEIIFLNSINKPLRDRSCDYRACHRLQALMTCSRSFLNVCYAIGILSRWFVMMCWSAASLYQRLLNVSHWVYNLMQTHAIPYSLVGLVACISRSREHNCANYILLGKNYFVHIHILTKIYKNLKVITL